jgi:hypothetical protein
VSPALDFLMQAAYEQAMREREDEIARDRERLLAELDLDGSGMSEPEPVMAAPAPAPAPAPEPAAWEVRVYHGSAQPVVHSGEQGMAAAQTVGGEPDSSLPDPAANGDPLPLTPEMEQEIPIEE